MKMEQFWHSLKHNCLISKGYPGYIKQYFSSITQIYQGNVNPAIKSNTTVVPTKSDSDAIVCLQRYQGLKIDISLVY